MAVNVEQLGALERRLSMSVPVQDVDRQVDDRLKKLARNVKMAGFRPGKVPMKMVVQQYGPQVRSEVLGDAVQKAFAEAVKEANLKVAGYPSIEKKDGAADAPALEFSATFEVYPEVKVGDISGKEIERPQLAVDDAAVERTLEILRKQRVSYVAAERAAQEGDRVTIDFEGKIDGEVFQGGKAAGFAFMLGEKRMLPEFEAAALGLKAGESKSFELKFPEDYHGKDVAGKTADVHDRGQEGRGAEAARAGRGVRQAAGRGRRRPGEDARRRARQRGARGEEARRGAAQGPGAAGCCWMRRPWSCPSRWCRWRHQRLVEQAVAELQAKGMKIEKLPFDPQAFEATAKRRVALGLIIGELARSRETAAQARRSARADRGGVAELRASGRGGKVVLHAAAALVRNGEPRARKQRRQLGPVEGQG